jgi:signal transduction histidine kinase
MSVGFPASAKSGLFDSEGKILAGSGYEAPHPGMAAGRDISGSAVWAHAATRPTTEWFGLGLDKIDRIIFFGYPDSTPWVTTVAYSQSELFDPLWDLVWTFAGVLGLTLIGAVVVGKMFVRRERRSVESIETERVTLDAVMNGATDGIMVIDNQDSVNFTNRSLSDLIGLEPGSLVSKSIEAAQLQIANLGDDPEEALGQIKDAMKVDDRVQVSHLALKNTVGLEFEITSYPVITDGGSLLGRTLVFHDVSKAKAVSRMKSQFLMTASHQFRTPMASILTFAEISMSRDAPLPK